jgi:TRAP-type mannitol/chloroaromatic compound transport system permease small subunit
MGSVWEFIQSGWLNEHILELLVGGMGLALLLSFVPKIDYIADSVSKFFLWLGMGALLILTFIVFYDITARKLFHGGSIALQELEWHLYGITFLFGIGYTMAVDKHVRVDILYTHFPKRVKLGINFVAILFFAIPLALLIITQALPFVVDSYLQHEKSGDPGGLCCRWIIKSMMVVAFLVVYLQSIGELRKIYRRWREGQ